MSSRRIEVIGIKDKPVMGVLGSIGRFYLLALLSAAGVAFAASPSTLPGPTTLVGPTTLPEPTTLAEPSTTDAALLADLNTSLPGMKRVKDAAQANNLQAVQQAYLDYRRHGSPVKWRVMPADKPSAPVEVSDSAGDEVCAHIISPSNRSMPKKVFMGNPFDWTLNPVPASDPSFTLEWNWWIARTVFWETLSDAYWKTNDEKYAREFVSQLEDFIMQNSPEAPSVNSGAGLMWRSLDTALRMNESWPYAYFHFVNSPSFTPQAQWMMLRSIRDQGLFLRKGLDNPERSGNWVSDECFGLFTIAVLFPELGESDEWEKFAIDRLTSELNRMVMPDGFEAELTPGYHYVSAGHFMNALLLARLNRLAVPATYAGRVAAMFRAPVLVMNQSGLDVCTNDSWIVNAQREARVDGLRIAPDDPLLQWAASDGKEGVAPPASTMLPYAGFYAMRSGWEPNDTFVFFRGGPVGIGHEHQDMLEVVLHAFGKDLLIDPGSYSYDHSESRRYVIGTASHNTIIVDGKWQHRLPDKVISEPVDNPWIATPSFDFVSAEYQSGYQQNVYASDLRYQPMRWVGPVDQSVTHTRRVLFLKPNYALVLDSLNGTGVHTFDAHFHIDAPSAQLDDSSQAVFSKRDDGVNVALFPLERDHLITQIVQGQTEPMLGWLPEEHRSIPTVRFRKAQGCPATFATLLYPYQKSRPTLTPLPRPSSDAGVWSAAFESQHERVELALSLNDHPLAITMNSQALGAVRVNAAEIVVRTSNDGSISVGMGMLSSYSDKGFQFTLDKPCAVILKTEKTHRSIFNASDAIVTLSVKKPFEQDISLAAMQWTDVPQ